jgi:hypothetical protein
MSVSVFSKKRSLSDQNEIFHKLLDFLWMSEMIDQTKAIISWNNVIFMKREFIYFGWHFLETVNYIQRITSPSKSNVLFCLLKSFINDFGLWTQRINERRTKIWVFFLPRELNRMPHLKMSSLTWKTFINQNIHRSDVQQLITSLNVEFQKNPNSPLWKFLERQIGGETPHWKFSLLKIPPMFCSLRKVSINFDVKWWRICVHFHWTFPFPRFLIQRQPRPIVRRDCELMNAKVFLISNFVIVSHRNRRAISGMLKNWNTKLIILSIIDLDIDFLESSEFFLDLTS